MGKAPESGGQGTSNAIAATYELPQLIIEEKATDEQRQAAANFNDFAHQQPHLLLNTLNALQTLPPLHIETVEPLLSREARAAKAVIQLFLKERADRVIMFDPQTQEAINTDPDIDALLEIRRGGNDTEERRNRARLMNIGIYVGRLANAVTETKGSLPAVNSLLPNHSAPKSTQTA